MNNSNRIIPRASTERTGRQPRSFFETGVASRTLLLTCASVFALVVWPKSLSAQETAANTPATSDITEMAAFRVSTERDNGYFARNTLAGTRTNERVLNIPQNIQIVTPKLLQDLAIDNGVDAIAYASSGINKRAQLQSDMFIRGFRVSSVLKDNITSGGGGAMNTPLYDIDRIEVIKGPAALLFGRSASTGGLINYISKRPSAKRESDVKATIGSFNNYRVEANTTGEIAKDFNLRATVAATDSEGSQDLTYFEDRFVSFSVDHQLSSKALVNLYYSYYHLDRILPSTVVDTTGTRISAADDFSFYEPWTKGINYTHNIGLTFIDAISPSLELQAKVAYVTDTLDWVTVNAGAAANATTGLIPRNVNVSLYGPDNQTLTGLVDLVKSFNTGSVEHKVTFGGLFIGAHNQFQGHNFTLAPINYRTPVHTTPAPVYTLGVVTPDTIGAPTNRTDRVREDSFYIQEQATMFKGRLIAVAGWRYNEFLTDSTNHVTNVVTSFHPSASVKRYGVVVKPLTYLAVYYNYSESFVFNNGTLRGGPRDGQLLDPSFGQNKEIGVKVETPDGHFYASAAAFDLTLTNVRTLYIQPNGTDGIAQAGRHNNKGYEMDVGTFWETSVGPFQALVTYFAGDQKDENDRLPNGVTNHMASAFASQTINLGADRSFSFGLGAFYKGPVPFASASGQTVPYVAPSFTAGTGFVAYNMKRLRLALNVDNITDKDYVNGGQNAVWLDVNPGRTFKFTATYRF